MAISKIYINSNTTTLKDFLLDSGLFDSVTVSSNTVSCYDSDSNLVATINNNTSYGNVITTLYANNSLNTGNITHTGNITYGYKCNNGIMLRVYNSSGDYNNTIMFSRTNGGKIACVCSIQNASQTTGANHLSFWAIANGDVSPLNSYSFSKNTRNQTSIIPFMTCNDLSASSYTPNAGYIPNGQYYNMGYGSIVIEQTTYLTNGYWVIKDA